MLRHIGCAGATAVGQEQIAVGKSGKAQYLLDPGSRDVDPLQLLSQLEGFRREAPTDDGGCITNFILDCFGVGLNE